MITKAFAIRGVVPATITPFDRAGRPDAARAIPYYRELLESGCDGLNLLGTTGEGVSIGLDDRLAFMQALGQSGIPGERLIVGTGACALGDVTRLTRAAFDLGFAGALIIPPFYYRDATDSGIVRFFAALIDAVRPPANSLLLYNFPRMSGITFTIDLIDRLVSEFPNEIAGVKDSSNDADFEIALHDRFPSLAIYPGSEEHLLTARTHGFAGCISGSVCLWPQLAQEVWSGGDAGQAEALASARAQLKGLPLIAAVRQRLAAERGDRAWLHSAPPLL